MGFFRWPQPVCAGRQSLEGLALVRGCLAHSGRATVVVGARSPRAILERAVKAGKLALGPDGFAEYVGHFWGFLETRPYMRARHALAEDLW